MMAGMELLRTTDNNGGQMRVPEACLQDLLAIGNADLDTLCRQNPNLLVFPQSFGEWRDGIGSSRIFTISGDHLRTGNVMGFVGRGGTRLTIASRFAFSDSHDYFLHYMLRRVFDVNMLDFDQSPGHDGSLNFLAYLFPACLKRAYAQGMFKAYVSRLHDDASVRGRVDVARHLRRNTPFCGSVAYVTREYSADNAVTQLVRHTVEYLRKLPWACGLLSANAETRDIVARLCLATQPTYRLQDRGKVMAANMKPLAHPYFTKYRTLQCLCLRILMHGRLDYGLEHGEVCGLLFDGAWLWEEYLATVLGHDFVHPENKTGRHRHWLFENFQPIYPDFIGRAEPHVVADAKYMPLGGRKELGADSERATAIYYKTITYMYRFKSTRGLLIFPNSEKAFMDVYKIKDTAGQLCKLGLAIVQDSGGFAAFIEAMRRSEAAFRTVVGDFVSGALNLHAAKPV